MSVQIAVSKVLVSYGLQEDDVRTLLRGLEFDMNVMAVRDAAGGRLTNAQIRYVKDCLKRGQRPAVIVESIIKSISTDPSSISEN